MCTTRLGASRRGLREESDLKAGRFEYRPPNDDAIVFAHGMFSGVAFGSGDATHFAEITRHALDRDGDRPGRGHSERGGKPPMHEEAGAIRPWLSDQTRRRLEQELAELRARHRELNQAISDTDGVEDRGDQAQRLEFADDLARVSARTREITEVLAGRVKPSSADALPEGTRVTIRFSDGGTETMKVVTIPDGTIETLTRDSPLGRALVGAQPGDTITYCGPDGDVVADVITIQPPGSRR
jgi:transcription elongation GreA/GreB family factor